MPVNEIVEVAITFDKMQVDGQWWHTWIVTGSDSPALAVNVAQGNIHNSTLWAKGASFSTLTPASKGIALTGFAASPVQPGCLLIVAVAQVGASGYGVERPNTGFGSSIKFDNGVWSQAKQHGG